MFNNDWDIVLKDIIDSAYFNDLMNKVNQEYENNIVYPKKEDLFKALRLLNYADVKVVIVGQDPYHGEGEAHGLAFSVPEGIKIPPSLRNIFKELNNDLDIVRTKTDLTDWEKSGVLLLNSVLTVKKDTPGSHSKLGWQIFTDEIIKKLNERNKPLVFILWGNYAISKEVLITNNKHLVIKSVHPSPLSASRGFFGSKPFSKTNDFLENNNIKKIEW